MCDRVNLKLAVEDTQQVAAMQQFRRQSWPSLITTPTAEQSTL